MAEVSPPGLTQTNQRYLNEHTPPERIKSLPVPPPKWKRHSPNVTTDVADKLIKTFQTMDLNDSVDAMMNEGLMKKQTHDVNNEKNQLSFGLNDSFCLDDSLSISSNEYASNSCVNDSSVLNSCEDDPPDTSTPHQSIVSNSKYKMLRPPDLVIEEANFEQNLQEVEDLNQLSPVPSPFPGSSSDDSLFSNEETPQPIDCETPPSGFYLKENQRKMVHLLKRFGLNHLAFIFIEQEVDVEMFLTLDEKDLKEIGIKKNTDRNILLSVISECNARLYERKN
ncbi:uncharacterized protein [Fopius arisanus]|uniref:ANKS6 protein n=1 Tax=Fopius arisanus TaxID=64838 RepID=A0A0C9Q8H0_9HYME|nr:PREDICTED: uncharacterized protein LOC105274291 [Fopius arisanus]